jgi:acetyl esterase/lipase
LVLQTFDQTFACPGGISLKYDFFRPEGPDVSIPLIVCIHGGGWISGQKEDMHELAKLLVAKGYAAACPQYRLAPLHPFPAAVEDVYAFVTHARAEASSLGVDSTQFASLGISAGGHLACMAGLSAYSDSRVQAVVDVCGISDLTDPHGQHFPISLGFLEQFMAHPYEGNQELYEAASPIHQVKPGAPPFLIVHGDIDDVVPAGQSVALTEALKEAGSEAELHVFPNEGHSFSWEAWSKIEELTYGFLARTLR